MKKILPVFIIALLTGNILSAQYQYEVLVERPNEKSYKGLISKEILQADTSFKWYAQNLIGYNPDKVAIDGLQKHKDSLQLLVFMGTWCEDSQFIIPKLFSLTEAAGFPADRITLLGTDRKKKSFGSLSLALNITNVPTIAVLKQGKELGRVVEYGKYGVFDKELGEIISNAFPVQ
ncbi:MAG: thioredoxin family protein [Chitinophagaceae bacterium]|nr:thioredoxin family protein [Chitinophagaceae bacterium]